MQKGVAEKQNELKRNASWFRTRELGEVETHLPIKLTNREVLN